jgi:hypothetical protein
MPDALVVVDRAHPRAHVALGAAMNEGADAVNMSTIVSVAV